MNFNQRVYLFLAGFFVFYLASGGLYAQEATVSSGSKATGPGGTVQYTVGQVVYMEANGESGAIAHGTQQPFVIEAVTAIENHNIDLFYSMYPNPTSDYIILEFKQKSIDLNGSYYSIHDTNGSLIMKKELKETRTQIPMKELPASTYIITTHVNNNVAKTFRVIKN